MTAKEVITIIDIPENIEQILNNINSNTSKFDLSKLQKLERAFILNYPSLYCLKFKPIKGKPLTFISTKNPYKHRPWQQKILDDKHPNKVIEKSRQLGLSELGISEIIWFLDVHEETKALYAFPRRQQMRDFSNSRITPAFNQSEYLKQLLSKEVNSTDLKKINKSYLFMRSAWGSAMGEGADIDLLSLDEYDRMKDNVELAFEEGLKSSKYGLIRRWSTPTIPDKGINLLYNKSDQMRYIWTCEHCGEKQFLTLEDNIIQINSKGVNDVTQEIEEDTFIIGCKKCKRELNRWGIGEWVSFKPSIKDTRGYHISQLDAVWISADDIMKRQFNYPSKQLFYNYVIGQPYASLGMIIVDEDIRESIKLEKEIMSRTNDYSYICAGIDWGMMNWLTICGVNKSGKTDLLSIYWAKDNPTKPLEPVSMFCSILRAYQPDIIIADEGYGADRNAFLYTQFPRALYSCRFTTVKNPMARVKFIDQWDENSHQVVVDKTSKMQKVLHLIKGRQISLFKWCEKIEILCKHLKNVRIIDEESEGQVYQVATRVGADHLACALCYSIIGIDKCTNYNTQNNAQFTYEFI